MKATLFFFCLLLSLRLAGQGFQLPVAQYDTLNCPAYRVENGDTLVRGVLYNANEVKQTCLLCPAVYVVPLYRYRYELKTIPVTYRRLQAILRRIEELEQKALRKP